MANVATTRAGVAATVAACLCTAAVGSASAAAPVTPAATPAAAVKVTTCTKGPTAAERVAVFRAGMRTLTGASRLSVRFELQESVAGAAYHGVQAPGLGVWRRSRAGVGKFAYRQRVKALAQGSNYRVYVQFRWQTAKGKVLKRTARRSKPCRQAEPLPNLAVQRIAATRIAGSPDRAQYAITLINRGTAAAPASNVKLLADGSTVKRAAVPVLAAGQTTKVLLEARRCAVNLTALADPDLLVRESNEADNSRTTGCPVG